MCDGLPKRVVLGEATKSRIAELREAGNSFGTIARIVGCSYSAVDYTCLILGADPPKLRRVNPRNWPQVMRRGDHDVRRFTDEEDARITALALEGKTSVEIGRLIGRKHNSVYARLATLARRDDRAERLNAMQAQGSQTAGCANV